MVSRSLAVAALVALLATPAAALGQTTPADGLAPIVPVPSATTGGATSTPPAAATTPAAPPPVTSPPATTTTAGSPLTTPELLANVSGTGGASTIPHPRPWVVLVLVVGGLLLLLLLAVGVARWRAWDPPWLRRARHSCAEASWRLGNTWAEFTDWVRLGR